MGAIISYHDCKNTGQDTLYGENRRVFNEAFEKGKSPRRYRCTVCGETKII